MIRYSRPVQALVALAQWPFDVEWTENPLSWPHCNGQAGCWMHASTPPAPWCGCLCRWCRVARAVRRDGDRVSRSDASVSEPPKDLGTVDSPIQPG